MSKLLSNSFKPLIVIICASLALAVLADELPGVTQSSTLRQHLQEVLLSKDPRYTPRTRHYKAGKTPRFINRLILEDSPYLQQHAHNPVNWYAWGPEAFQIAKGENKPVFLSIGYSTCHWCHVMEHESFENLEVAGFLNKHFISIKVDRERRPDIDKLYMTAIQSMNLRGGWPMSSFLDHKGRTFTGGTYWPREQFLQILSRVDTAWRDEQPLVQREALRIASAVASTMQSRDRASKIDGEVVHNAVAGLHLMHDAKNGGFSNRPKFPSESKYWLLLDQALRADEAETRSLLQFDLEKMAQGGIHDHVGGGFHRYATDEKWLVPHFEKMLYNQAQLARVYTRAWYLTNNNSFARTARGILDYVIRDMTSPDAGFYSATDTDSDGEEGRYFIWTPETMRQALSPQDAELAISLYGVEPSGNFENQSILHLPLSLHEFAVQEKMPLAELLDRVSAINQSLYASRNLRPKPLRDEKIVTAWNGMMILALIEAADAFGSSSYLDAAVRAADYLWENHRQKNGRLWRVGFDGRFSTDAVQEDYAWLADAFIGLYDQTEDTRWLQRAIQLVDTMNTPYWDDKTGGYFMSSSTDLLEAMPRLKDAQDSAVPSGNAVALYVLTKLKQRTGDRLYEQKANALLAAFANDINDHPSAYSYLLSASQLFFNGDLGQSQYAGAGAIKISAEMNGTDVSMSIKIQPGWHINANKVRRKNLIPTELSLIESLKGWRIGSVSYPQPVYKTLGILDEKLALYEGEININFAVSSTKSSDKELFIPTELALQACSDKICLPSERHVFLLRHAP